MRFEIQPSKKPFQPDELKKRMQEGINAGIEKAAILLEGKMAEKVSEGSIPPPLKPATIKRKRSSATLIDKGELLRDITHEIDFIFTYPGKEAVAKVGVIGPRAEIAQHHEYGAPGAGIPERSFIRATVAAEKDKVKKIFYQEIHHWI